MSAPIQQIVALVLSEQDIVISQPQDQKLALAENGPVLPARFFEGAWTSYIVERNLPGDNGVLFHDLTPIEAQVDRQTGYSVMNRTRYSDLVARGTWNLVIDIIRPDQVWRVWQFLQQDLRIGGKKSTNGLIKIEADLPNPALLVKLDPPAWKSVHTCSNCGEAADEAGGTCPACKAEILPRWYADGIANRPWQGDPRNWGSRDLLMSSLEEILNKDLGLELPIDSSRIYTPVFGEPEEGHFEVTTENLKVLGLPVLPWTMDTCHLWRARLDVLAGLALIFKAQPGVSVETAITAAAVIHRLLTGFVLKPENSGEWAKLVNQKLAAEIFADAQEYFRFLTEELGKKITFQHVAYYVIDQFPVIHTASLEYRGGAQ